jgi:hypothetical protein
MHERESCYLRGVGPHLRVEFGRVAGAVDVFLSQTVRDFTTVSGFTLEDAGGTS